MNSNIADILLQALDLQEYERKYIAAFLIASTLTDLTQRDLAAEICMIKTDSLYMHAKEVNNQ